MLHGSSFVAGLFNTALGNYLLPEIPLVEIFAQEKFVHSSQLEHRKFIRQHIERKVRIDETFTYTVPRNPEYVAVIASQFRKMIGTEQLRIPRI